MVTALLGLFLLQAAPCAIIRGATHSVEADSAGPARARWETALKNSPSDRPALLALATLERQGHLATGGRLLKRALS